MHGRLSSTPEIDSLTEQIIGCFYFVYNEFGPGLLEAAYQRALAVELRYRLFQVESEVRFSLLHRGVPVGDYRADLIVNKRVLVECKAVEKIAAPHVAQLKTYLKATNLPVGLILNFGPEPHIRRVDNPRRQLRSNSN